MSDTTIEGGSVMTLEEVRKSAEKAAIIGQAKAFADGTVSAVSGEGDSTYMQKIRRKMVADKLMGNDPRGNFAQSGAAELVKNKK